jgi:hypothetical protein
MQIKLQGISTATMRSDALETLPRLWEVCKAPLLMSHTPVVA